VPGLSFEIIPARVTTDADAYAVMRVTRKVYDVINLNGDVRLANFHLFARSFVNGWYVP